MPSPVAIRRRSLCYHVSAASLPAPRLAQVSQDGNESSMVYRAAAAVFEPGTVSVWRTAENWQGFASPDDSRR